MSSRQSKDTLRRNPPRGKPHDDEPKETREELLRGSGSGSKNPKQTSKKSKYFPDDDSNSEHNVQSWDGDRDGRGALSSTNGDAVNDSGDDSANPEEDTKTKEGHPKTNKRGGWGWAHGRKRKAGDTEACDAQPSAKGRALWKDGVKTGLGPGKEVFIKLPQAREPGDTPYEDETLHPNTMLFLKDLKENNEREWLKRHDADYRTSKKDWETFVECLTEKIIEKDSTIPELPVKDLVFRVYRDVRFSKDPTPYKNNFSAAWSRTGRKGPYAVYYLHLEPGSCFIAAGIWMPTAEQIALLRDDIDRRPYRIKEILTDAGIRRRIFSNVPDDEEKAVDAFFELNQNGALKTRPKGFDINHENIKLLRLRNFTLSNSLEDEDLMGPDALDKIADLVGIMAPFVTYLNKVVMPDSEDSGEESGGGDESSNADISNGD